MAGQQLCLISLQRVVNKLARNHPLVSQRMAAIVRGELMYDSRVNGCLSGSLSSLGEISAPASEESWSDLLHFAIFNC